MGIPTFRIGNLEMKLFQGGMGVGISGWRLASAVANEGGAGIIAGVEWGTLKGYPGKHDEANMNALRHEIRQAKKAITNPRGVLGVNIMKVLSKYEGLVEVSVQEKVCFITSGAGDPFPIDLPKYVPRESGIILVPIVSSAKGARLVCKRWKKQFDYIPDAIVVEGPKAGGHLGFKPEELANFEFVESYLRREIPEVVRVVRQYEIEKGVYIPVIAAGGIFSGADIKEARLWGADGVQMATRFVPTYECDASLEFKQTYIDCKNGDLKIICSPVGLPGRVIDGDFVFEDPNHGCRSHCLRTCRPSESPYCIADALINAQKGDLQKGFVFAGSNAYKCNEIISVSELMGQLDSEYDKAMSS